MPSVDKWPQVEIYTDGGCDPNPGFGGWGAVLKHGNRSKEIEGACASTTNNRMELLAVISALRILKHPCKVQLYTDSQYVRRGITTWLMSWQTNGWRTRDGEAVENQDLWRDLAQEVDRHRVQWYWVKGHAGNPLNERADQLAREARQEETSRQNVRTVTDEDSGSALPKVEIYTRGCALKIPEKGSGTSGVGGYAAVLVRDGEKEVVSGAWPGATNNVMELWAVVAGLQALREPSAVTIHTLSKYVLHGATQWLAGWERNNWRTRSGGQVKNKEIWLELSHVMGDHNIAWEFLPEDERGSLTQDAARIAREEAEKKVERAQGG